MYTQKCGNDTLIEQLEKRKSKLLKKSYVDDPEGKTREILLQTNREHRALLELFQRQSGDELFDYLMKVHWNPENAAYDVSK